MQNGQENTIPLNLISRFLSGEITPDEGEMLNAWITTSPENLKIFGEYRNVWEKTGELQGKPAFNLDEEWSHLQSTIGLRKGEEKRDLIRFKPYTFGSFYKLAAILVMGLFFALSIYYFTGRSSVITYVSLKGKEVVELPDGSTVTLNKGAEIEYPKEFSKDERLVKFSGEGFFQIEKNPKKPFIVTSNNLSIRVLGTSFNVRANPSSHETEVVVSTGIVGVYLGSDRSSEQNVQAGQRAVFDKNLKEIKVSGNSNQNFLSWKTGKMMFNNASLSEVLEVLTSVYHADFETEERDIHDCRITVSFDQQDLKSVLEVLEATLDIEFETKGNGILLRGDCK